LITIGFARAPYFQLSLYGERFKPVGQAHIKPPPQSRWNLRVAPDGSVSPRS
jgi:hypothetical protein